MSAARVGTRIALGAALVLGALPSARLGAQAAVITAPKQAAQRAAAASNAQLQSQMSQVQSATPGQGQARAIQGPGAATQRTGPATGVVQSGAPNAGVTAPVPRAAATADPANSIMREVFDYNVQGRRDPFYSLMATGDLRPMLSDLRLSTILYDPTGRRPVAVMNDVSTNQQYRVTTGMMLGRMRVTQIRQRSVIFAIDEFGFSRADSLVLADKPNTRK
jgi:hypothetical protein